MTILMMKNKKHSNKINNLFKKSMNEMKRYEI